MSAVAEMNSGIGPPPARSYCHVATSGQSLSRSCTKPGARKPIPHRFGQTRPATHEVVGGDALLFAHAPIASRAHRNSRSRGDPVFDISADRLQLGFILLRRAQGG